MLVLTRKSNQSVMIGDDIEVTVLSIIVEKVRIGIRAPREIPVFRKEIYLEIQQENAAARASAQAEVDDALKRLSTSPSSVTRSAIQLENTSPSSLPWSRRTQSSAPISGTRRGPREQRLR
jgi:carbon storage regulator